MGLAERESESETAANLWNDAVALLTEPKTNLGVIELPINTERERRVAALVLIAFICYPKDARNREKFISAFLATMFKSFRDLYQMYVPGTERFRRDMESKAVRRAIRRANLIVRKRFEVAQEITAAVAPQRLGHSDYGVSSISKAILKYANKRNMDEANFRQRLWKPTLPVLHIVLGMLAAMSGNWARFQKQTLVELITVSGSEWVPPTIHNSTIFLDLLITASIIKDVGPVYAFRARQCL